MWHTAAQHVSTVCHVIRMSVGFVVCDHENPNRSFDVDSAGGDSDGDLPPRFQRGRAPLAPTDTPKLWEQSLSLLYSSMNVSQINCYVSSSLSVPVLTSLRSSLVLSMKTRRSLYLNCSLSDETANIDIFQQSILLGLIFIIIITSIHWTATNYKCFVLPKSFRVKI